MTPEPRTGDIIPANPETTVFLVEESLRMAIIDVLRLYGREHGREVVAFLLMAEMNRRFPQ